MTGETGKLQEDRKRGRPPTCYDCGLVDALFPDLRRNLPVSPVIDKSQIGSVGGNTRMEEWTSGNLVITTNHLCRYNYGKTSVKNNGQ